MWIWLEDLMQNALRQLVSGFCCFVLDLLSKVEMVESTVNQKLVVD